MNVLVTGANGQLGRALRRIAMPSGNAPEGTEKMADVPSGASPDGSESTLRFIFTDVTEGAEYLDITDLEAVRSAVKAHSIGAIVNCAAYTNVEKAEEQPELARLLNVTAVENLSTAMKEVDGLLVHISTDYIFDGSASEPYPEQAQPRPLGVYGRTKWEGEQAVFRSGVRHVILRTAWLYSEYGNNFVKTMLRLTAERPTLQVVNDQLGTPTYAGDLANGILRVLEAWKAPTSREASAFLLASREVGTFQACAKETAHAGNIFHFTDEGQCTWYEFACEIAALSGHTGCEIRPCTSSEYPSKVQRPAYSVLDKSLIKATMGLSIPHWKDSLRVCLSNLPPQ